MSLGITHDTRLFYYHSSKGLNVTSRCFVSVLNHAMNAIPYVRRSNLNVRSRVEVIAKSDKMTTALLIICLFTVCFCMIAKRASKTIFTAPMIFIAFGYAMAQTGIMPVGEAEHLLHLVAEIALIILLFLDAAQIDFDELRKRHIWPVRMLAYGLPLSVIFGTVVVWLLLPDWPIFAVILVAAILAPTDAALGQAVVTNSAVPERVRRALTVESGLNDGWTSCWYCCWLHRWPYVDPCSG